MAKKIYRRSRAYGAYSPYSGGRSSGYSRYVGARGGRSYYRSRRNYVKRTETIGLYNPGVEYAAGAVVGVSDLDDLIPAPLKIGLAVAPLKGGIGGKVSRFFRGVLLGDIIAHYTGFKLPIKSGVTGQGTNNVTGGW